MRAWWSPAIATAGRSQHDCGNGERDRELARLQKRIDCFETDDKTLAEKVNELRTNQARILGLLENKDKSLSRRDKYIIFIFGSIVTVCGIVAGIVL